MSAIKDLKSQFFTASYDELLSLCASLQSNLAEIGAVEADDEAVRLTLQAYQTLLMDALELATQTASHIGQQKD